MGNDNYGGTTAEQRRRGAKAITKGIMSLHNSAVDFFAQRRANAMRKQAKAIKTIDFGIKKKDKLGLEKMF